MFALVRRARRRLFSNELFAQLANTASAALAGFILLLVFGAEVLTWQWLLLMPVLAASIGLFLAWGRRPSPYRTAQIVDQRLGLADTLSTAMYFSGAGPRTGVSPDLVRMQSAAAERLCESVDVRRAVPFTLPRTAYAMAALVLVAGSLFALRYAVSRRLDLHPPLAALLNWNLNADNPQAARDQPPAARTREAPQDDAEQILADAQDGKPGDPKDEADRSLEASSEKLAQAEAKSDEAGQQAQQGAAAGDPEDGDADEHPGNSDPDSSQQGEGKEAKPGNSQDANNPSDSSLMSKFKDAVENLLSRMKPQAGQAGGQQKTGDPNHQQGKGQQNGGKQQSAQNGQQQGGQQQGEGQPAENGEPSQDQQDAQSKGAGNSDAKLASKQPGSGIGSQDGDKSIRQAEQLRAMGKISEIIGKRAQNITGETTVEVQSTSQVLRTPYALRSAQHAESGAEINRDEIPVALEAYVEQYFEQVRKQAPAKK